MPQKDQTSPATLSRLSVGMNDCYRREPATVLRELDVDAALGLTEVEAVLRLNEYGLKEALRQEILPGDLLSHVSM